LWDFIAKSSIIKNDQRNSFYELYPEYKNAASNKFTWNVELLSLTLSGKKTMTSSLLKHYQPGNVPDVGLISFIYDEFDKVICVIKIINVEYHKFSQVPEYVAIKEGEGNQSLSYYMSCHEQFFKSIDQTFNHDDIVVVEEFELIHKF
jgi:uncharacterized protein YhfF